MKILSSYIKWFLYITTGILIVCTSVFLLSGAKTISVNNLWYILLSGLLTTIVTVFCSPKEESKRPLPVQFLMHYLALCAVMSVCGCLFGWISRDIAGIIMMMVYVALVYVIAFVVYYILDIRQADAINKKLKEIYGDEE